MTLSYAKFLLCDDKVFKVKCTVQFVILQKCIQVHKGGYRNMISEELHCKKLTIEKQGIYSNMLICFCTYNVVFLKLWKVVTAM